LKSTDQFEECGKATGVLSKVVALHTAIEQSWANLPHEKYQFSA